MKRDDIPLWEKLCAFSNRAKSVETRCTSEAQTKASLVNRYLAECLGYDVSDPSLIRLEFVADIGKSGEKVDYAIMCGNRPSIFIEAKSATEKISDGNVPTQLQRYFISEKVDFAAYTNGLIWMWYRPEGGGPRLESAPFLVHDVRSPSPLELRWLQGVAGPDLDPDRAREQADDTFMVSAALSWIEEMRERPSKELAKLIIRGKTLGNANASRVDRMQRLFVEAVKIHDSPREHWIGQPEIAVNVPRKKEKKKEEVRGIDLEDGLPPLKSKGYHYHRAWRIRGGRWRRVDAGKILMLEVIRHLASIDVRGKQRYYAEAADSRGRLFRNVEVKPVHWQRVEEGFDWWVLTHLGNKDKERFLARACALVKRPDGATIQLGEDIEVLLDI